MFVYFHCHYKQCSLENLWIFFISSCCWHKKQIFGVRQRISCPLHTLFINFGITLFYSKMSKKEYISDFTDGPLVSSPSIFNQNISYMQTCSVAKMHFKVMSPCGGHFILIPVLYICECFHTIDSNSYLLLGILSYITMLFFNRSRVTGEIVSRVMI